MDKLNQLGLICVIISVLIGCLTCYIEEMPEDEAEHNLYLASQYLGILIIVILGVILYPITKLITFLRGH